MEKPPLLGFGFKIESVIPARRADSIGRAGTKGMLAQQREFVIRTHFAEPVRGRLSEVAELRLALPQCLFGALAFRDIDVCADRLKKLPMRGEQMMTNCFKIFDCSIG